MKFKEHFNCKDCKQNNEQITQIKKELRKLQQKALTEHKLVGSDFSEEINRSVTKIISILTEENNEE